MTPGQVERINVRRRRPQKEEEEKLPGEDERKSEGGESKRRELDQELEDPEGYTRRNAWEG